MWAKLMTLTETERERERERWKLCRGNWSNKNHENEMKRDFYFYDTTHTDKRRAI